VSLCTTKRSHITAEPPKDDIPDALQFISSDAELPVDGLLPNDEFEWIKTFIDSSPPDVHAYRERVPGYRWTTGSRTYATAYPSLTSTRGRIARNSTSSSAPRPTPWSSTSTCACTPSRTASADEVQILHHVVDLFCGLETWCGSLTTRCAHCMIDSQISEIAHTMSSDCWPIEEKKGKKKLY